MNQSKQKLHIIICSTRPTRVGPLVATWFDGFARQHSNFDVRLVDLADFNLPVFDEPNHPRMQKYENPHTLAWAESVRSADAFVFVTPEYNFGTPPALTNALNYLFLEWNYKPCAFVSYGGISGGLRSVQMTKQTVTTLKMMPVTEAVTIPFVGEQLVDGAFHANDFHEQSAQSMLDELHKWSVALCRLREDQQASPV